MRSICIAARNGHQDPIQIETILKECMERFSVKALHFYLDEDPDEGSLIFTVPVKGGHVILRVCEDFGYAGLDIMNMNGDFIPENWALPSVKWDRISQR